jgi:flagellar hook-basal body complex protein FliE
LSDLALFDGGEMAITPITSKITPLSSTVSKPSVTTAVQSVENSFSSVLQNIESSQENSDNLLSKLAAGEDVDLSQLMIATQETDINFRVAMAIRDRLVDAYNQVMRITV